VCVATVERVERENYKSAASFLWKGKAKAKPGDARCCELCDIPVFLYPSEFPGVCENCVQRLRQFECKELAPCPRCGRGHTEKLTCRFCNKEMCEGCIYRDHRDEEDEMREVWNR